MHHRKKYKDECNCEKRHLCQCGCDGYVTKPSHMWIRGHNPTQSQFGKDQSVDTKNTHIERRLQYGLRILRIDFIPHTKIEGVKSEPDIFIPPNICIYAEGARYHITKLEQRRKDEKIDIHLRAKGMKVVRLSEFDITNHLRRCLYQIIERHRLKLKIDYRERLRTIRDRKGPDGKGDFRSYLRELELLKELIQIDKKERPSASKPYVQFIEAIESLRRPRKRRSRAH